MRLLLDTHTLLWHREGNDQLSSTAKAMIADNANQVVIGVASLWEMSIKRSLGKLTTAKTPIELVEIYQNGGAKLLPISPNHTMAIESLPWHHRDPFDRMLVAQAKVEGLILISKDEVFRRYDVMRTW